ncbi:RluA family pseudouridine synthase [Nitrosomonas sp.]|uniref:RluA family pseudouridine synthase n=1 Tax=Nitrosomonas sp. TaxID=42353 RepID=UPI0025DBF1AF|nr:RluA family pseudouridine synthase [Nitrosomonas sp.]
MNASVVIERIVEDGDNQRIDNFFFKRFKNVPKSHIYQLLRSGQVRVNGKRVNFHYRLQAGDQLRIPPVRTPLTQHSQQQKKLPVSFVAFDIVFEDAALLVVNKPSGIAVHGGSGVSFGVIEQLRAQRPELRFLELVHRLDRETSGVLMLAKKRSALVELHRQIRSGLTEKHYQVVVKGKWSNSTQNVRLPLIKYMTAEGERRVAVATAKSPLSQGQGTPKVMAAHTLFKLVKAWQNFSLLDAELKTGRTHQIRIHLAHLGYPIVGDDKYGDFTLNKQLAKNQSSMGQALGLARMFLHADSMKIEHPLSGQQLDLKAPLPNDLRAFILQLERAV